MAPCLSLIANNPEDAAACTKPGGKQSAAALKNLAVALTSLVQHRQVRAARLVLAANHLSPIALGVVAAAMARAGVSEKAVLRLL